MSDNNVWGSSDNMVLLSSKTPWYFGKKFIPIPEKFSIDVSDDAAKIKKNNLTNKKNNKNDTNSKPSMNNSDRKKILLLLFLLIIVIVGM